LEALRPESVFDHAGLKKLSWQLLCQASTFREISFEEMLDVLHTNGFHHIGLSPGQSLSPDHKDTKVGPEMSLATSKCSTRS